MSESWLRSWFSSSPTPLSSSDRNGERGGDGGMAGPDHNEGSGDKDDGKGNSNVGVSGRKRTSSSLRATMSLADMKQGRSGPCTMMTRGRDCNSSVKVGDYSLLLLCMEVVGRSRNLPDTLSGPIMAILQLYRTNETQILPSPE